MKYSVERQARLQSNSHLSMDDNGWKDELIVSSSPFKQSQNLSQRILIWLDRLPTWYHMALRYCLPKDLMQDLLIVVPLEAQWVTPCFYCRHISVPGWEIKSQYCVVQSGGGKKHKNVLHYFCQSLLGKAAKV